MDIDGDIERELANQAAEPSPSAPKASAPAPSGAPKVSAFPPAQEPPPAQERRDAASTIKELMGKTFYEILGLDPGCSNAQIRKAFGKISLEYHPDKGGSTNVFQFLAMVRDVLLDTKKRKQYDAEGKGPFVGPWEERERSGRGRSLLRQAWKTLSCLHLI
jgi:hypothetical protein